MKKKEDNKKFDKYVKAFEDMDNNIRNCKLSMEKGEKYNFKCRDCPYLNMCMEAISMTLSDICAFMAEFIRNKKSRNAKLYDFMDEMSNKKEKGEKDEKDFNSRMFT